jgi:uncharacterized membrane protein
VTSDSPSPPLELRVLAAVCYIPGLCVLPFFLNESDPFVRHHARQGIVLLFVEVVLGIALEILASTVGRVPLLGAALVGLLKLLAGLSCLALAATGAARAALGDRVRLPIIAGYADRLSS